MNEILKIFFSLSVSGSIIALILFALKPLLKDKFSKTWQYYIWLIVIIRLLLPFSLETNFVGQLFSRIDKMITIQNETVGQLNNFPVITDNFVSPSAQANKNQLMQENTQQKNVANCWREIKNSLWLLWLGVAVMLLVRKVTSYHSFVRYIKAGANEVSSNKILEIFSASCMATGLKKPLKIYTNPLATSAMLVGFINPFVVVPNKEIGEKNLHNIFIHELTHYKRLDIFYKWLTQFAVCIHWYNPLVYFISREINKNCELSCDEIIIKGFDDKDKRNYGDTLLASLKFNGNYGNTIVSITLNEDAKLLKERLGAIMKFKKKSKLVVAFSTILAITILCGATVTGAYAIANSKTNIHTTDNIANNIKSNDRATLTENMVVNTKTQKINRQFNNAKIKTIKLNITDCANVIVQKSDNENFQYEYYEFLYDISSKINNNKLTITAIQKPNMQQFITGDMENFIRILLPNYVDEKIIVNALNSGITLNERNINYEIVSSNSMAILFIPKDFDKNILCNSENGSVTTYFDSSANNYTFTLSKDSNSFATLLNEFTDYQNNNTYKYVKGNSVATIDISLKSSYFLAQLYTVQSENTKETTSNNTNSQANLNIPQNSDKDDAFSDLDNAAIALMEYTGSWELVENFIPNMSKNSIDRLVEIYNQKNQYTSLAKKKSSDYYNVTGTSADLRALAIMETTGTWKFAYVLFPYMSNEGIDKVVEVYNQRHQGSEKVSSDYYNTP